MITNETITSHKELKKVHSIEEFLIEHYECVNVRFQKQNDTVI